MSFEITTFVPCSINCNLCPQDVLMRHYKGHSLLSLDDFKTVLDKLPRDIVITFSGFSEPFLNPHALDMIEYASLKGHKIDLFSTLVGLKARDVQRLSQANIRCFVLHLQDNLGNAHIPTNNEEYRNAFFSVLRNITVDDCSIMNKNFPNNERAGNLGMKHYKKGPFRCNHLENNIFVLLPNCDVVLCCMDFGIEHNLGNLLKQSYSEIVNCKEHKMIRRNRFMFDGDILCRRCKCAYNPIFYSLLKADRTLRRFALRFYSSDVQVRDKLIEEYNAQSKTG